MRQKLLVTGFGPFPRMKHNPSAGLAERVAADPRWRRLGVEARALVLETSYAAIERDLIPAIRAFAPDAVLMLGVAGRRKRIAIETRAANRVSRMMPDASGRVSESLVFRKGEPSFLRAHAPVAGILRALRHRGAPAYASRDAGRYLCNAAYFATLKEAGDERFRVVFLHIPVAFPKPSPRRKYSIAAMPAPNRIKRLARSRETVQPGVFDAAREFLIARRRSPSKRIR